MGAAPPLPPCSIIEQKKEGRSMYIILNKWQVLLGLRELSEEWHTVENRRGEVTFQRRSIIIDILQLLRLTDCASFEAVFGKGEGSRMWKAEQ